MTQPYYSDPWVSLYLGDAQYVHMTVRDLVALLTGTRPTEET